MPRGKDEDVMTLDLSGVELDVEIPLYLITLADGKKGTSGAGKDKYTYNCRVEKPAQYKGRRFPADFSLSPNALFGIHGLLKALGVSKEDLASKEYRFKPTEWFSHQVCCKMVERTDPSGNKRIQPAAWAPASDYSEEEEGKGF